jgi:SAM-dependent methyltransferase
VKIFRYISKVSNFKFRFIKKSFSNRVFRLLDVGAGNHSASKITSLFPHCEYFGLDISKEYNNDIQDFRVMKGFFELDLTLLDYSKIPDQYFDGIWMSHVIEHLYNGEEVIPKLLEKLKPGGYFYLEYPGKKSLNLPSMKGTLNFKDDATHVKVYSITPMERIFEENNCKVLSSGTRRSWWYIAAIPVRIVSSLMRYGYIQGNVFWDALGFAEYLWVKKTSYSQN